MTDVSENGPKPPEPKAITSAAAFGGLCTMLNREAQLRQSRLQLAASLNLLAYAGIISRLLGLPEMAELIVLVLAAMIFIGLNMFVHKIIERDGEYLDFYNDTLDDLEQTNKIEGGVEIFSSERYRLLRTSPERLQSRLLTALRLCIVGWGVIAFAAFILFLTV